MPATAAPDTTRTKGLTKTTTSGSVKAIGSGEVEVAFAQLNVVDHDGDYTIPGAFQPGQKVKMCQTGHAHGLLPAGAGEIVGEERGSDGTMWAVAKLKFFLNTAAGKEHYETIKALAEAGHAQEWSYGYDVLDAAPVQVDGKHANALKALSVYEISPVLRGAGIGTHTRSIKEKADDDRTCETCGQALPDDDDDGKGKADDQLETCPDCEKDAADCSCEADADAKGRTANLHLTFLANQAQRSFSVPID